jgi:hypothetical protein
MSFWIQNDFWIVLISFTKIINGIMCKNTRKWRETGRVKWERNEQYNKTQINNINIYNW